MMQGQQKQQNQNICYYLELYLVWCYSHELQNDILVNGILHSQDCIEAKKFLESSDFMA